MYFKGTGGPDKKVYEANLKFFGEINPDTVKYAVRPRCIEFVFERVGSTFTLCSELVLPEKRVGRRGCSSGSSVGLISVCVPPKTLKLYLKLLSSALNTNYAAFSNANHSFNILQETNFIICRYLLNTYCIYYLKFYSYPVSNALATSVL